MTTKDHQAVAAALAQAAAALGDALNVLRAAGATGKGPRAVSSARWSVVRAADALDDPDHPADYRKALDYSERVDATTPSRNRR